jgi:NADPH-dependent 2,4-dienoyl-CoA reductase/sulfur reductase-like enzyme
MPNSTRRDFLKSAGQGTLAAGLYMNLPHGAWITADMQGTQSVYTENKMECDVLVVGGGYAACFAAIKARELGASVIMVDKGNPGRSGQSPGQTHLKIH